MAQPVVETVVTEQMVTILPLWEQTTQLLPQAVVVAVPQITKQENQEGPAVAAVIPAVLKAMVRPTKAEMEEPLADPLVAAAVLELLALMVVQLEEPGVMVFHHQLLIPPLFVAAAAVVVCITAHRGLVVLVAVAMLATKQPAK